MKQDLDANDYQQDKMKKERKLYLHHIRLHASEKLSFGHIIRNKTKDKIAQNELSVSGQNVEETR